MCIRIVCSLLAVLLAVNPVLGQTSDQSERREVPAERIKIVFSEQSPQYINLVIQGHRFNFEQCVKGEEDGECTLLSQYWNPIDKINIFGDQLMDVAESRKEDARNRLPSEVLSNSLNFVALFWDSVAGSILGYIYSPAFQRWASGRTVGVLLSQVVADIKASPRMAAVSFLTLLGLNALALYGDYEIIKEAKAIQAMPIEEVVEAVRSEQGIPTYEPVDGGETVRQIIWMIESALRNTTAITGPSEV